MKRISVRRVASVIVTAMAMTLVFATLGWAMMPQWNTRPYTKHIVIASADTTITPAHANIPHEGRYRTRETRLSIKTGDGVTLPAVLRVPVGAPGPRPACLFIHGSGTSGAEDFGDIANAMASAGIVTLVPAKRNDNYTVLHRDYPRFAREYGRSLDVLRGRIGVDPAKTGIYAESEGTWIATILTSKRQDIAFAILTSAPVFNGREQMAMAVSAYTHEAGAPKPVVKDMAKLMSLDYAPFDLAYADFDADRYLKSLTMPVLVNYGTYDTAMPIEQGAQRIIATANKSGNENVTVRYFAGNHQMRAGEGLFTPNLPLAEGYTSQRTRSGIVGSLGVLAGLMVAGPVLIVMAAILGIGLTVFSWLQTLLAGRRSVATVRAVHATPSELGAAQRRMLHGIAGLSAGIGTAVMVITGLLYGYMSAVGVSAVLVMPQPRLFAVGWVVLRIATMLLVVLFAWEMERVWYCRADIVGVRRVICVMVALGTLATLMTLAFWGLFSL